MMVEAGANEVSETAMLDAIMFGHEYIKKLVEFQDKIVAEIGKEKVEVPLNVTGDDVKQAVREFAYDKCVWVFDTFNRQERQAREAQVKQETIEALAEQFPEREAEIADALYYLNKEVMRKKIIEQGIRPDGRGVTEIRPIWCEVGVLPRVHGSARVHPWSDAGADRDHARFYQRGSGAGWPVQRGLQALHPPLQHAAVRHGRSGAPQEPRSPRNRPWRTGGARTAACHPL